MRCIPFLLPLLLPPTILALPGPGLYKEAATSNQLSNNVVSSICSGILGCLPFLSSGLEEDEEYLSRFRYYNYHEKASALLASKIARTLNIDEEVVLRAVNDTNEVLRIAFNLNEHAQARVLADALERYVQPVHYRLLPEMIQTSMETVKAELEEQSDYETRAVGLYNYEDDWNMDNRIATILRIKKDSMPTRMDFSNMMRFNHFYIRGYLKNLPLTNDRMILYKKKLLEVMVPDYRNTFNVLETLQQARERIRQQKSENPVWIIDDDSCMIALLPELLQTDPIEIQEAVQQARDEITFLHAVYRSRLPTVRKFIEARKGFSDISLEFKAAAKYTMYACDFRMLNVLLQHHAIAPIHFYLLLDAAISWEPEDVSESNTLEKKRKMISFLLDYDQVGRHEIEWALWKLYQFEGNYTSLKRYLLLVGVFVKSGKITMEEVDRLISGFKINVRTALMESGPITIEDVGV